MKKVLICHVSRLVCASGVTVFLLGLLLAFDALGAWSSLNFGIIEGYDILRMVSLSTSR